MFPPRRSLLEVLANASPEALQDSAAESKLRQWLPALPSPQLLKGGLLRILPYRISVY